MLASTSGRSILGLRIGPALAAGAGGDVDVDPLGDVLRRGGGALARLVVGVRVHVHQPESGPGLVRHGGESRACVQPIEGRARWTWAVSADLAERYGTAQPWRRTALVAVAAVLVLAFLGWLAWATWFHANPAVESQLSTYKIVDQHEATAVVAVSLDDGADASCRVRALAQDHSVVGELSFTPRDGDNAGLGPHRADRHLRGPRRLHRRRAAPLALRSPLRAGRC